VAKLAREIDTLTKMIHAQVCDGDG